MVKISHPSFFFGSFASSFKNAVLKNSNKFLTHYSKLNSQICEYLLKNFFFSEVYYLFSCSLNSTFIFVVINNCEGSLVFNYIRFFYKKSNVTSFDLYQLKRKVKREKSSYLLSTSEGILSSTEAIYIGIGGIVLFEYF